MTKKIPGTTGAAGLAKGMALKVGRLAHRQAATDDPSSGNRVATAMTTIGVSPLLASCAEAEIRVRAMRRSFLSPTLLGEPAWDILLELFLHASRHKRVSMTMAASASRVPETTARRWLALLQEEGLIECIATPDLDEEAHVGLTDRGLRALSSCLAYRAALPL